MTMRFEKITSVKTEFTTRRLQEEKDLRMVCREETHIFQKKRILTFSIL